MALIYDNRAALAGKPGLHALIVGVSDYAFLPDAGQPLSDETWYMRKLSATSMTALLVYQWLAAVNAADCLALPLATVRLLLSPTAEETARMAGVPEVGTDGTIRPQNMAAPSPATRANFVAQANQWRRDATKNHEDGTLFYFAGHGVQRTKGDQVLLLSDFGDPDAGPLANAIDTNNLRYGMAPSSQVPEIARTQVYFIDACRNLPSQIQQFQTLNAADVFAVPLSGLDDRRAPIFYASIPDGTSFSLPGDQTLFSKALLQCLQSDAAQPPEDGGADRWNVSYHSLGNVLTDVLRRTSQTLGADQQCIADGFGADAVLCYLDGPPRVPVTLQVDPSAALTCARVNVTDVTGSPALPVSFPVSPNPLQTDLPAGFYSVSASINPPTPPFADYQRIFQVRPPGATWTVKVGTGP